MPQKWQILAYIIYIPIRFRSCSCSPRMVFHAFWFTQFGPFYCPHASPCDRGSPLWYRTGAVPVQGMLHWHLEAQVCLPGCSLSMMWRVSQVTPTLLLGKMIEGVTFSDRTSCYEWCISPEINGEIQLARAMGGGLDIFVNFRHTFFIQCFLVFSLLLFSNFTNVAIVSCEAMFHSPNSA